MTVYPEIWSRSVELWCGDVNKWILSLSESSDVSLERCIYNYRIYLHIL